ncbi:MAG: 2Fe-2S ferredoxin-type domain-containing protein [Monoraphidium minutum]|nr:MAG: 2Fe-2S ferredoxin-type domain-containing protein [Monoraphidium minutum]
MAFTMSTRAARTAAAPAARRAAAAAPRTAVRARYTVTLQLPDGAQKSFECAPDQLILEAAEANGIELPFMCRTGTCCTCAGKRVEGELVEPDQGLLSPEFEQMGFALMCSSYPRSDLTIVTHAEEDFIQTSHIYDKQMNLAGAN